MDEETKVSLLANEQDVHLLREIAKWRRATGITYWRSHGKLGRFTQWSEVGRSGRQVSVDFTRGDEGWHAEMVVGLKRVLGGVKLCDDDRTLTQAIDVLVALGYLPPRFSSAYRLGWDKANGFAQAREERRWVAPFDYNACLPANEAVF